MTPSFTQWLNATFLSGSPAVFPHSAPKPAHCSGSQEKCYGHLMDLLAGQMGDEDEQQMKVNLEACKPCFNEFDLQVAIREALKHKVKMEEVPNSLLEDIRTKITSMA
jgi:anti-sigma factor (TIGR02949 family)